MMNHFMNTENLYMNSQQVLCILVFAMQNSPQRGIIYVYAAYILGLFPDEIKPYVECIVSFQ